MNYCSLEDAWGGGNRMCNQYKNYMDEKNVNDTKQKHKLEQFSDISYQSPHENSMRKEHCSLSVQPIQKCGDFLNHIHTCRQCRNKVKNYFKPKIVENFQDIVEDNKDTIVLILIGISILLFFNLINNMTKSK
jgi:hypothetical protein